MKTIIIILLFNFFINVSQIFGQDIHFTNFFSAPQILNPANTGNDQNCFRVQNNYRKQGNQIANPYITNVFSFDMPVYYYSEKAAVGFIYINDKSADKTLISNQFYLTSGYFRKISNFSYLHIGFQVGYVFKKYSLNNLTFPDQFDMSSGYFSSAISTNENLSMLKSNYFDLNWGLMWSIKKQKFTSELGFAMFHYNRPDQSFFDNKDKLPARYTIHAFVKKSFFQNAYVKPKLLFTFQNKANETLAGFDLGTRLNNAQLKDIRIGFGYRGGLKRISDAIEFNIGAIYKRLNITMAFDLDISNQKNKVMARNAIEISVTYICPEYSLKSRVMPCEIY